MTAVKRLRNMKPNNIAALTGFAVMFLILGVMLVSIAKRPLGPSASATPLDYAVLFSIVIILLLTGA